MSFMGTKSQPDAGSVQSWMRVKGWRQSLCPIFLSPRHPGHLVSSGVFSWGAVTMKRNSKRT